MLAPKRYLFQCLTLSPLALGLLSFPAIAHNKFQTVALGPINVRIILEAEKGDNESFDDSGNDTEIEYDPLDPHIRWSPTRPLGEGDQARADRVVEEVRAAIAPYTDITVAEADGYLPFPPDPSGLRIVQYVNVLRSWQENWELNPQEPGSLLYERQPDGSLQLIGAAFSAPEAATTAELNNRLPLSIARWYQHTNLCMPDPVWDADQWALEYQGRPRFGPESVISSPAVCAAVGGDFWPTVFGWMVDVRVFADDSADVWNPID